MYKSLTGKVWFYVIVLIIFILGISWIMQVYYLDKFYINQIIFELTQDSQDMSKLLVQKDSKGIQDKLTEIAINTKGRITIIDWEGNVVHVNNYMGFRRANPVNSEQLTRIFSGERVEVKTTNPGLNTSTLTVGFPLNDGEQVLAALIFNVPIENMDAAVRVIKTQFLYIIIGAILLSILFAYILSRFLTRPLVNMNKIAGVMAQGDLSVRIDEISRDEIGQLGNTLNYMAKSLSNTMSNLNQNNQKLDSIISSIGDGIVTIDVEGKVIHLNTKASKLIDIPVEGGTIDEKHFLFHHVNEAREKKGDIYLERKVSDKIYAYRVSPYHNNGRVMGTVITISDITKEKNLDNLRREFIASVSHELRTPISLIQGYSEALRDGIAKDINREEEFIEVIYSESEKLGKLVEDILDMSSMESGGFKVKLEAFDLPSLVDRVISRTRVLASQVNVELLNLVDGNLPLAMGDERRIEQVLVNLISNSIANTEPEGKITVASKLEGDSLIIEIEDTGRGIPRDQLDYIWDRFYKVDKSRNRKFGGTGLGLAIVKNILESHKSNYGVSSEVGVGTIFYFSLKVDLQ